MSVTVLGNLCVRLWDKLTDASHGIVYDVTWPSVCLLHRNARNLLDLAEKEQGILGVTAVVRGVIIMRYSSFLDWISETCRKVEHGLLSEIAVDPKCGDAISDDFFENRRMKRLAEALKANKTVEVFILRNVPIGKKGCKFLKDVLMANEGLKTLVLEDTRGDGTSMAVEVAKGLECNKTIEVLHLKANGITSEGCGALGRMLSSNRVIREIRLCHNHIDRDAALAFGLGLEENTALETLDLSGNNMNDSCIKAICKGLNRHPSLCFLCFDFNNFGIKGVEAIATMLKSNSVLRNLHLFGNHIDEIGGRSLADALTHNRSLRTLILSFNDLGDVGASHLAEALQYNETLRKLWLPANHLGNEGIRAFAKFLPSMKGLKQLNVGDYFDNEGARALRESIKINTELEVLYMESVLFDDEAMERDVDFYIRLNRAGRRLFRQVDFPMSLWPGVLSRADQFNLDGPDVLFHILREKPDLFESTCPS